MIIVGGVYRERCIVGDWDQIYGSGGRAAAALVGRLPKVRLHTYSEKSAADELKRILGSQGVDVHCSDSPQTIEFDYFHPLSRPRVYWKSDLLAPPLHVSAEKALRFGMLEGEAIVQAERAVFDPQSSNVRYRDNGSSAQAVATILNDKELLHLTGEKEISAGAQGLIGPDHPDDVVVVKCGPNGAQVHQFGKAAKLIPAYRSETVFKIGSGDVFSAIFAYYWAHEGQAPELAADLASRSVSHYVATSSLPIPPEQKLKAGEALPTDRSPGSVYLAGPFFSTAQRWLIEELRMALSELGCSVFSPVHDVGFGMPEDVAKADLSGLDGCNVVLALVDGSDPGTWYEVGYARARSIPVVLLAEAVNERDLTMAQGTDCVITRDLCSAAYHAVWASMK